MKLRDIARVLHADVEGDDTRDIARVAKIEEAGETDITFLANPKYEKFLATTQASAVILDKTTRVPDGRRFTLLRVEDPYLSFLTVLQTLDPPPDPVPPGIHSSAIIAPSANLGQDVRIGAHVLVGGQCAIGDGSMLGHGVVLGDRVTVGARTVLHPNVTVREGCSVGSHVIIHSGTTIGSDGFGFAPKPDGTYEKIPQRGTVVIEDDVEIGANCAIDRATLGETRIKKGAKLDNLIQVAHNVVIGENTVIAAQAGISGSTKLGKNCMVGGQVGFAGHLDIADHSKFAAQSGVHRSVQEPGESFIWTPAFPYREGLRVLGALHLLPDVLAKIRELRRTVERLEKKVQTLEQMRVTDKRGR
jgi:UDP-3-O-[3-hydroxymyristoyl] glucosamine N-acyltransferase